MRNVVPAVVLATLLLSACAPAQARQQAPPLPAASTAAPSSPRWFTNAENVRRVTPGETHVAFATSGGIRLWDRAADSWYLVTMNDGLPTNNVYDVAFDPEHPQTLWALCGDWVKVETDPMPRLRLATVDVGTGAVTPVGPPSGIAPKTSRSYIYFLDYRLAVTKELAAVTAGNRAVLAFDRAAGQWAQRVPANAPVARGSHLPGLSATVTDIIANAKYAAVLLKTGVFLYDRQTDQWSPRPFPGQQGTPRVESRNRTNLNEGMIATAGTLRFTGDSGAVTFHGFKYRIVQERREDGSTRVTTETESGRIRANPATTGFVVEDGRAASISQTIPAQGAARTAAPAPAQSSTPRTAAAAPAPVPALRPRPQIMYCTDMVGDGKYLWIVGYNQPYRQRSGGIARLDMDTGEWHHPKPPAGGIAANVGVLTRFRSGRIAYQSPSFSLYDAAARQFGDLKDFSLLRDELERDNPVLNRSVVRDPRLGPDEQGVMISLLGTLDDHTSIAYAPEEPFRFGQDGRPSGVLTNFITFLYDHRTLEMTPISNRIPEMKGFRPQIVRKSGEVLFLVGETVRPVPPRVPNAPPPPAPEPPLLTVWRWDPKTGEAHREERVTWTEAQRERDARLRRWREQMERRQRGIREPIEPTPATSLVEAAGQLWLMWERCLYRYDPRAGAWVAEGRADSLHPEAPGALWALIHARNGQPGVARFWSPTTGWQRAQVDPVTASMLAAFAPDRDTLWFGGGGVVAMPRAMVRFALESPE